jgi:hypothetical protein
MDNSEKARVIFWLVIIGLLLWCVHAQAVDDEDMPDTQPIVTYHRVSNFRVSSGSEECNWIHYFCVSILTRA